MYFFREWRRLECPDICLQTEQTDDDGSDWTDDEETEDECGGGGAAAAGGCSGGGRLKVGQWVLCRLKQLGPKRPPFHRAQIKQVK